jgi:hypothetical protein
VRGPWKYFERPRSVWVPYRWLGQGWRRGENAIAEAIAERKSGPGKQKLLEYNGVIFEVPASAVRSVF